MGLKLNGATSGSVELDVPAAIGSDLSMTVPATAGTILAADPTKLSVDSSGRLLHPARPSFLARGTSGNVAQPSTGDSSLLSSLFTVVSGSYGIHNVGNHYNTSTGIFTVPITGLYLCTGHIRWETGLFTMNAYIRTFVDVSGSSHSGNRFVLHQISGQNEAFTSYMDQNVGGVVYLQAGDEVTLRGGMDGGTARLHSIESSFGVTFLG
jgi:hypothetical protein